MRSYSASAEIGDQRRGDRQEPARSPGSRRSCRARLANVRPLQLLVEQPAAEDDGEHADRRPEIVLVAADPLQKCARLRSHPPSRLPSPCRRGACWHSRARSRDAFGDTATIGAVLSAKRSPRPRSPARTGTGRPAARARGGSRRRSGCAHRGQASPGCRTPRRPSARAIAPDASACALAPAAGGSKTTAPKAASSVGATGLRKRSRRRVVTGLRPRDAARGIVERGEQRRVAFDRGHRRAPREAQAEGAAAGEEIEDRPRHRRHGRGRPRPSPPRPRPRPGGSRRRAGGASRRRRRSRGAGSRRPRVRRPSAGRAPASPPRRPRAASTRSSGRPAPVTAMSRPLSAATTAIRAGSPRLHGEPRRSRGACRGASTIAGTSTGHSSIGDDLVGAAPLEAEDEARAPSLTAENTARRRVPVAIGDDRLDLGVDRRRARRTSPRPRASRRDRRRAPCAGGRSRRRCRNAGRPAATRSGLAAVDLDEPAAVAAPLDRRPSRRAA